MWKEYQIEKIKINWKIETSYYFFCNMMAYFSL